MLTTYFKQSFYLLNKNLKTVIPRQKDLDGVAPLMTKSSCGNCAPLQ